MSRDDQVTMIAGVSAPKQLRSRRSFEKVRRAVLDILRERADGSFSIAEISARSGVSVGAIYGRVAGKAELLRAVQAEEYDVVDADIADRLKSAGADASSLASAIGDVVTAFARGMRDNAAVLTPFFALSASDETLRQRGRQSAGAHQSALIEALDRVAQMHGRELAEEDLVWTQELLTSTLTRHIDFGAPTSGFAQKVYTWDELTARLRDSALRYLRIT